MYRLLFNGGGGWTTSTIKKLTNASATRAAILEALSSFSASAVSGDTFLYYQSSHGYDQVLCAADADIPASDLGECLRNFSRGVRVLCVIDACHSGSLPLQGKAAGRTGNGMDFAAFISDVNRTIGGIDLLARGGPSTIASSEIGWCTAVDADNLSYDRGRTFGGLFSYPFIRSAHAGFADATCFSCGGVDLSCGNGDGACTADEAFDCAYHVVVTVSERLGVNHGSAQTPQIFNREACAGVIMSKTDRENDLGKAVDCNLAFQSYARCFDEELVKGAGFFVQTNDCRVGESALSCSSPFPECVCVLETTVAVAGRGFVSFWWKTSSDIPVDAKAMRMLVDGKVVAEYSGSEWRQENVEIPGDGHCRIAWEYAIDADGMSLATTVNDNCCYVDGIEFATHVQLEGEALDNNRLSFRSFSSCQGQDDTWRLVADDAAFGGSMMSVGGLPQGSWASVSTEVAGPCIVDWDWRCVSAGEGATLGFFMDQQRVFSIGGSLAWMRPYVFVPSGWHALEWRYEQTAGNSGGDVCAASLDHVSVHYPVTFDRAVDELPACSYIREGTFFCEAGAGLALPDAAPRWMCDADGQVYRAGALFTMPMSEVGFSAIGESFPTEPGMFEFSYESPLAVSGKGKWNGFVEDESGLVVGLMEVKAAALKNGKSKVTFAVTMFDKKKVKVKGEMSLNLGSGPDCTAVGGGLSIEAYFRHQNVWGSVDGYYFDCARDFFSDRKAGSSDAYKARINAAKANYAMSVLSRPQSGRVEMGNGFVGLSLAVGANGKTKITGVLPDGTKVNSTVYTAADDAGLWIPVWAQVKGGCFGVGLLSLDDFAVKGGVDGSWSGDKLQSTLIFDGAGKVSSHIPPHDVMEFYMPPSFGTYPSSIAGSPVIAVSLPGNSSPMTVQFVGSKWVPLVNNPCGLNLSYVQKTGLVKGNFTIFTADSKKYKANVNGAFLNGRGNCFAGVKNMVTMPMSIAPLR